MSPGDASSKMNAILEKLQGTDRRSIGRVGEVVRKVLDEPGLFGVVFEGMLADDPVIRMRCADAVEKITLEHPEYLLPYKQRLFQQVSKIDQQEVRWHVAQLFSRMELSRRERHILVRILQDYLGDKSKIVKTFAMQALADIAEQDIQLRAGIVKQIEKLTRIGSPAMKSRGRKLLAKLKPNGQKELKDIVELE
jgi:hypothetical protein